MTPPARRRARVCFGNAGAPAAQSERREILGREQTARSPAAVGRSARARAFRSAVMQPADLARIEHSFMPIPLQHGSSPRATILSMVGSLQRGCTRQNEVAVKSMSTGVADTRSLHRCTSIATNFVAVTICHPAKHTRGPFSRCQALRNLAISLTSSAKDDACP